MPAPHSSLAKYGPLYHPEDATRLSSSSSLWTSAQVAAVAVAVALGVLLLSFSVQYALLPQETSHAMATERLQGAALSMRKGFTSPFSTLAEPSASTAPLSCPKTDCPVTSCPACPAPPPPEPCPTIATKDEGASTISMCTRNADYPLLEHIPPRVLEYCTSPYPLTPYEPSTLALDQLVIGLLTVDTWQHERDEFVLHTWMNPIRAPRTYFTCSIPRPHEALQPCVHIPDTHDLFLSNINKTMLGLRELYYKHPDAAWFMLSGDDDYVVPVHILHKLQKLNHSAPVFAGGAGIKGKCANTDADVEFFSGAGGIIASNGLMAATHHLMAEWIENKWMRGKEGNFRDGGDVAVACFFQELGYERTYLKGFHVGNPRDSWLMSFHDPNHRDYDDEVCQWHYIGHLAHLYGDIFFGMQMVDRLQSNKQWTQLATYARELIVERYYRQKRSLTLIVGSELASKQT